MLLPLADHAIPLDLPVWDRLIVPVLTILIYGILGPMVYLIILVIGVDLSWPGGTGLRRLTQRRGLLRANASASSDPSGAAPTFVSPDAPTGNGPAGGDTTPGQALSADSTSRTLRAVGGLVAVAVLSTVTTIWLAGYPTEVRAPLLSTAFATLHRMIFFLLVLLSGFVGGFLWTAGMRTARTARACLTVLAFSMSLSSTLLFFYIVEPGLRDLLLVLALGIFAGELFVAAQHPTFTSEGLFAELLHPPASEATLPAGDDGAFPGAEAPADADEWRAQTPTRSFVTADSSPANDDSDAPLPPPPTSSSGPPAETTNG